MNSASIWGQGGRMLERTMRTALGRLGAFKFKLESSEIALAFRAIQSPSLSLRDYTKNV